jgi:hypothetical protein
MRVFYLDTNPSGSYRLPHDGINGSYAQEAGPIRQAGAVFLTPQVERLLCEQLQDVGVSVDQFVEVCGQGGLIRRDVNRQVRRLHHYKTLPPR